MYRCAEDLNETAFLELLGEVNYEFNGYWFTIGGGFQDPPMDRSIPEYLIVIRRKEMKYNEYDINNDICRISFRRAEFVEHTNKSKKGLPQFHIDSDTRDRMIAYFLDGGWEETLAEFNVHIKQQLGAAEANSYNFYCEMPNYMELSPLDKRFSKK